MPRKRKSYPELEALRHLLGKVPDHEVAARAGTSASIVGRYRRSLKIDAYDGYKFGTGVKKPEDGAEQAAPVVEEAAAAPEPVAEPAADEPATPGRKSKITPFHDQVGAIPDKEVAELAGVSTEAVRMYRRRRGIELNVEKKAVQKKKRKPSRRKSRLDPYFDELGKVPDAEVAAKAGVTPENVRAYRSRHGIKAEYRGGRRKAEAPAAVAAAAVEVAAPVEVAPVETAPVEVAVVEAAPVEAAPVEALVEADTPTSQAYSISVVGSEDVWVLFADDVAKAAMRAMGSLETIAPGGRIGSITHLGRALV